MLSLTTKLAFAATAVWWIGQSLTSFAPGHGGLLAGTRIDCISMTGSSDRIMWFAARDMSGQVSPRINRR